ncbi:MAG TPA: PEP-CTERM sorting domain-containing protein [Tepidisphaeraceae bacterium]|jgi:hypothetical protein
MHRINSCASVAAAALSLFAFSQVGQAAAITDSSKINVLRQYGVGNTNLVTRTTQGTATNLTGNPGNDGSAWSFQSSGGDFNSSKTAGEVFTLPSPRLVGAIHYEAGGYAVTSTVFEGFNVNTSAWEQLATTASGATQNFTIASPITVSAFRYLTTAPSGVAGNYFYVNELRLNEPTGQSVDTGDGFNFLRDKATVQGNSSSVSNTSTVWANSNGGDVANGTYNDALNAQTNSTAGGNRAFKSITLDASYGMSYAHLGFYHAQTWNNFELYTADGASMPATQALSANDPATIQAAGWTLQFQQGATTVGAQANMPFNTPGSYKYMLLVWNVQGDASSELEVFNVPEPASIAVAGFAGALVLLRRRRA